MSWREEAACLGANPDWFFPDRGASTRKAHQLCAGCPVKTECMEYAVETSQPFGIWGGSVDRGRRETRKAHVLQDGWKRCSKCLKTQPVTEFPASAGSADGFHSHCKECRRRHARSERGATGWAVQGKLQKGVKV